MTTSEALNRARPMLPYGLTIGMLLVAGAFIRDTRADASDAVIRADSAKLLADSALDMLAPVRSEVGTILYLICKDNPDSACRNARHP